MSIYIGQGNRGYSYEELEEAHESGEPILVTANQVDRMLQDYQTPWVEFEAEVPARADGLWDGFEVITWLGW